MVILWLAALTISTNVFAHGADGGPDGDGSEDQLIISVEVKGIGNSDMVAISRNNTIYLPVNVIFDFLKIRKTLTPSLDSIFGFYINEKDAYLIDRVHSRITFRDTVTNVQPGDILKMDDNLYLNVKYFKSVFRLDGVFNFRRMAMTLSSGTELPAIQEAERETMRRNLRRINGEVKTDTTIKSVYPRYHFGTADWGIMSSQQSTGQDDTRLSLGLGGTAAGGEMTANLNYYTSGLNNEKQQFYQWRHVNNDNPGLKQVMVGKIFAQPISTLSAPLVGIKLTNASTVSRRSYGSYTLSNTTEPGWTVELYVDGVLADYRKTDASGFYSFEVPLVYGYSTIKLRFYGPYGEERTTEQNISIPFNFLPAHQFEYMASAGIVEDDRHSLFSHAGINYGLSGKITVGGGMESLSSIKYAPILPFLSTAIKLAPRLLFSGDYAYGVKRRALLSYRLPTNSQLEVNYTKYVPGQQAINFNYLEERRAVLSVPVHTKVISLFSRFSFNQILIPRIQYTNLEWTLAGVVRSVGINISNYASYVRASNPYMYGLLSLSFRLPQKISFTPQLQYDYKNGAPIFMKFSLERRLFGNGYVNASYQEYFNNRNPLEQAQGSYRVVSLSVRYDLSFAKLAMSASADNRKGHTRIEYATGSLICDHKTGYANANNRASVGKGILLILPYLDINCNGKRDAGEPAVQDLKMKINGGRVVYDKKDTLVRVFDLEPYARYYIDLSKNNFDNVAWRIKNRSICISVSPNNITSLEVPITVSGEISGMVLLKSRKGGTPMGQQKVIVNIYDAGNNFIARTITESDGFFSYIGLAPGTYTLQPDSTQLQKMQLTTRQPPVSFQVQPKQDGDVVSDLELILESDKNNTSKE